MGVGGNAGAAPKGPGGVRAGLGERIREVTVLATPALHIVCPVSLGRLWAGALYHPYAVWAAGEVPAPHLLQLCQDSDKLRPPLSPQPREERSRALAWLLPQPWASTLDPGRASFREAAAVVLGH